VVVSRMWRSPYIEVILMLPSDPHPDLQSDWLPFTVNEIMYTDGVKTKGYITGSSNYLFHCHISSTRTIFIPSCRHSLCIADTLMNSAGRKGCESTLFLNVGQLVTLIKSLR